MHYKLNHRDLIVDLSSDWDDFANANAGQRACRESVIDRPLADFIAGDTTRMFMAAALQAVRLSGQPRRLSYRCDSPAMRRQFAMSVRPDADADGGVLVEHTLLHQQPRKPPMVAHRLLRQGWRCSLCLRARAVGDPEWREPESLQAEPVGYDVCPACTQQLFRSIQPSPSSRDAA